MSEAKLSHEADHTKVAPTAWGVAYLRTFTDIPLAKEMFDVLNTNLKIRGEEDVATRGSRDHLAPQLEARYKLVDRLVLETGIDQVLELASGVATHGINLSRSHSDITYVETDLSDVARHKRTIFKELDIEAPDNLAIREASALSEKELRQAIEGFDKSKAIVVMHEGLMRYLTFDEKTQLAGIVHRLLTEYGGVWITPDISMRQALSRENEKASGHTQSLKQTTGIDIEQNVFEDEQHAKDFFENLGFEVESHSFLEVTDQLVSPARLEMSKTDVKRLNEPCIAFVMKVAENE